MPGIYRGSTPTFKFKPIGVDISDLGDPTVTITQELVFLELATEVDTDENCLLAYLDYADSLLLVPGVKASIQAVYTDESGDTPKVVPFSVHELDVYQTHVEFEFDEEGTVVEP